MYKNIIVQIYLKFMFIYFYSNNAIPPRIQLMVTLRFYATGCFLQTIGDFCGISEVSALNIVHRVSPVIAALRPEFIKLPATPEEIRRNQQEFFQTAKFIRVIGCMDCTHIRVQSYGKKHFSFQYFYL